MRNWLGPSELDMPVRTLDYGHITATSSYSWEHTRALLLFTVGFQRTNLELSHAGELPGCGIGM